MTDAATNPRLMTRTEAKKYLRGIDPYQVCPPLSFGKQTRWDRQYLDYVMIDPPGAPKQWEVAGRTLPELVADQIALGEVVYFVQGEITGLIKIGSTGNILSRMGQLQRASADVLRLLHLQSGTRADELVLHATFAPWRKHGEWFEPAAPLLRYIAKHARPT